MERVTGPMGPRRPISEFPATQILLPVIVAYQQIIA